MPASFTASGGGGEQASASSRWPERHVGTVVRGSGIGPTTRTAAPVDRNRVTNRFRPATHAGSCGVNPDRRHTDVTCSADQLDHYRLRDDAWTVLFTSQNVTTSVMQAAAEAGVAIGYDSLAGIG